MNVVVRFTFGAVWNTLQPVTFKSCSNHDSRVFLSGKRKGLKILRRYPEIEKNIEAKTRKTKQ